MAKISRPVLLDLGTGTVDGELYFILFHHNLTVYVGSSARPQDGFARLKQHTRKLRAKTHRDVALQREWDALRVHNDYPIMRVVALVRNASERKQVKHYEWCLASFMQDKGYTLLNSDRVNKRTADLHTQGLFEAIYHELL